MPCVDSDYYDKVFKGEPVDDTDFPSLCKRAEEIIEELTMYRVILKNTSDMSEELQIRVKDAVCAQIEYLDANGGADMDTGIDFQSAGLGKFNYTKASGENGSSTQSIYSPRALRILAPTGLLYRGGTCI